MKIICLNTWGGRAGKEKFLDFFSQKKNDTDVFCLQEIWSAPYDDLEGLLAGGKPIDHSITMTRALQDISHVLANHRPVFHPAFRENWGLSTFIRADLAVQAEGDCFVHEYKGFVPEDDVGTCARNIQYITTTLGEKTVTILNFHGLWNGQGKLDTGARITQSKRIVDFLTTLTGEIVLCGDFNLLPETESLQIFRDFGLRDLIAEYGITSTRTSLYDKPLSFADYVFLYPKESPYMTLRSCQM